MDNSINVTNKAGIDGSIRIKSSLRISVNDAGDVILIPVEDTQFIDDFFGLLDAFSQASENIRKRTSGKETAAQVKPVVEEMRGMMTRLDNLFGEGCCQKVFGNIVPTPYIMADFFDQMVPILNKYANDRQSKIAEKYNRNRRGGTEPQNFPQNSGKSSNRKKRRNGQR